MSQSLYALSLGTDLHGFVDNLQPGFVNKTAKYPAQKGVRKFDNFRKKGFSP